MMCAGRALVPIHRRSQPIGRQRSLCTANDPVFTIHLQRHLHGQEVGRASQDLTRMKRIVGILVTAGILAGGLAYYRSVSRTAGPGGEASLAPKRGGQLVASIRAVPRSFNRIVAREQTAELLSFLTQGRLVRINRSTFDLEPWLAEKWETSPDGRTFTLHLRPGVTWSDGEPFTAADVLFTLQAGFDPKTESVRAEQR